MAAVPISQSASAQTAKRIDRAVTANMSGFVLVVRAVGIEPTLLSEPDFESGASTSSTTPALGRDLQASDAQRQLKAVSRPDCRII
jgi:hypothetical protein